MCGAMCGHKVWERKVGINSLMTTIKAFDLLIEYKTCQLMQE